jgi:hypothetical protein
VYKPEDTALALLLNLSYNYLKQAQFNAVVVQQKEMDRVGFEPTTSALLYVSAENLLVTKAISS